MSRRTKRAVVAVLAGLAVATVCAFAAIWLKFRRGDDFNSEPAVLAAAEAARLADDPPREAELRMRLMKLNPFRQDYVRDYCRALVRMRDFAALEPYAEQFDPQRDLTEDEKRLEKLLAAGWAEELRGRPQLAQPLFEQATNLNWYAAAPQLVDCLLRQRKIGEAASVAEAYLAKFEAPYLLLMLGEWCALGGERERLAGLLEKFPQRGRIPVVLGYYFEALGCWLDGDLAKAGAAFSPVRREIRSPLGLYLALQLDLAAGAAAEIEQSYLDLQRALPFLDFGERARADVKRYVAANFPDKLPLADLARLADMLLAGGMDDVELLRLSLLHRLETRSLSRAELELALKRHPRDAGLRRILEALPRMEADSRKAAEP